MGCSIFLPWCIYYFTLHQRRKCTCLSRRPEGNMILSAGVEKKN
ncbi:hypothetical protein TSAR_004968 [Trichomalopsis sarcophagae]|uniref:Uncharacterized protein n=1 Tax=Trichomalopsis sarcophagae TaxID=543379 RepID=A0A232EIR5_9HYME|nr:hypothetical protein TSAR_004968 [Trichomalopsis sarcophagae]